MIRPANATRFAAEDERRRQLIEATVASLAEVGFAASSLAEIAGRAGVAPSLVAHYFGDKERLLEATLRHLAKRVSESARLRLARAANPRERIQAVIDANLAPEEFDGRTCSVWLAFWGQVLHSVRLKRVQRVYQQRMLSNLRHDLKALVAEPDARRIAVAIAAVIDGLWLRSTLSDAGESDSFAARGIATSFADSQIALARPAVVTARPANPAGSGGRARLLTSHVGGRYVPAGAERFVTVNPATGAVLAEIASAGEAEIAQAVEAARAGQRVWGAMRGAERGRALRRVADAIRERGDELALLEAQDTGRPIRTTRVDAAAAAAEFDAYADLASARDGEPLDPGGYAFGRTRREPIGPVAGLAGGTAALRAAGRLAAPALAGGNAVILKPSGRAPLSALRLAEIVAAAGITDGVFNVVAGDDRAGRHLAAHPDIAAVSLAGKAETGRRVMIEAAATLKRFVFEPCGGLQIIVLADACLDEAVDAAMPGRAEAAGFFGGRRVLVQRAVKDAFAARLAERARRLVVGDPVDPRTEIGPLRSEAHLDDALSAIAEGRREGATILAGGGRAADGALGRGFFLEPTILDGCTDAMRIVCEGILGPVTPVLAFDDEDEVIGRAGGPAFAFAAVFTSDIGRAQRIAAGLRARSVWINPGKDVAHVACARGTDRAAMEALTESRSIAFGPGRRGP